MAAFFKVDASDVSSALLAFRRDITPFQLAYTLTKVAQDIRDGERELMREVFDRPTPYSMNSLFVKPATKNDPTAIVHFKEGGKGSIPGWKYLGPQVEGGHRAKKSHEVRLQRAGILRTDEYVVPGQGQRLDAYGNVRGSDIERILSQLGAAEQMAGYQANATNSRRSKAKRRVNAYFVLRGKRAPDGIYRRTSAGGIMPMLMFVKAPRYTKRFPFYERAQEIFNQRFAMRAREAWDRYPPRRAKAA